MEKEKLVGWWCVGVRVCVCLCVCVWKGRGREWERKRSQALGDLQHDLGGLVRKKLENGRRIDWKTRGHGPGYHRVTGVCQEPRRTHLPGEGMEEGWEACGQSEETAQGRDYTLKWWGTLCLPQVTVLPPTRPPRKKHIIFITTSFVTTLEFKSALGVIQLGSGIIQRSFSPAGKRVKASLCI